jgi:hypothetical protein
MSSQSACEPRPLPSPHTIVGNRATECMPLDNVLSEVLTHAELLVQGEVAVDNGIETC